MNGLTEEELIELGRVVNHDTRSAVRHIKEFYNILYSSLSDHYSEDDLEIHGFISSSIQSALNQTAALSSYLKLAGRAPESREVDLQALINSLLDDLELDATIQKKVVISLNQPAKIHSDPFLLKLIFKEILTNAIKFHVDKSHLSVQLTIDTERDETEGDTLIITCVDNGIGIMTRQIETAFKPFKRLNHKDEFSGVGMGLTMTKIAVDKLGGEISITGYDRKDEHSKHPDTKIQIKMPLQIPCYAPKGAVSTAKNDDTQ